MNDVPALPPALAVLAGNGVRNAALYLQALTHGSAGPAHYQRLEFLGDRVLGLTMAQALYERFPDEPEGSLSSRFNALVSREACADVARRLGLPALVTLGKQARDDGARDSDNIAADVIEALIGAIHIDQGPDAARAFVLTHWAPLMSGQQAAPRHPKSALQEKAAAMGRRVPVYELVARDGPPHAPRFRVRVSVGRLASAEGDGTSKHMAETAAAAALLSQLQEMGA